MLVLLLTMILISGPEQPSDVSSRADELQKAREQKAQNLQPPQRSFLEKGLYQLKEKRVMERLQDGVSGFHPLIGGMVTGSGFALGAGYTKDGFQSSVQGSLLGYQKYELKYSAPHLFGSRYFADFRTTYRNVGSPGTELEFAL